MKKLNTIIRYTCITSFKYIWIFYLFCFSITTLISLIIEISTGSFENGSNRLEINSMVYVGIIGGLGFNEDFKMLIQNGFTRKYIFFANLSLFAFISSIMALVDTVVGKVLHSVISNGYVSLFDSIYGFNHSLFANWLWLFVIYMFVSSLLYLVIIAFNKFGKAKSVYLGLVLGAVVLITIALFRYVLPSNFIESFIELFIKTMGFMSNGTINFVYPISLLLLIISILSFGSFLIIRRFELKG